MRVWFAQNPAVCVSSIGICNQPRDHLGSRGLRAAHQRTGGRVDVCDLHGPKPATCSLLNGPAPNKHVTGGNPVGAAIERTDRHDATVTKNHDLAGLIHRFGSKPETRSTAYGMQQSPCETS